MKTMTNSDYLTDMGRTFRRDDDHKAFAGRRGKPKNKQRKPKKNFSHQSYNVAESYEEFYSDEQGFEKFDGKRKGK